MAKKNSEETQKSGETKPAAKTGGEKKAAAKKVIEIWAEVGDKKYNVKENWVPEDFETSEEFEAYRRAAHIANKKAYLESQKD